MDTTHVISVCQDAQMGSADITYSGIQRKWSFVPVEESKGQGNFKREVMLLLSLNSEYSLGAIFFTERKSHFQTTKSSSVWLEYIMSKPTDKSGEHCGAR